jgi:hypothetical protein
MRITNELTIRGDRACLERLPGRVEALLRDGWKRDREAEERLGRWGVLRPWSSCFSCTAVGDRPAAGLWLHASSPGELTVSNVVPLQRQELSPEETNRLLEEFRREFLGPAAAELGVDVTVAEHRRTLEHELSGEARRLLRAFSAAANRTGLHPNDRRRWNAFLVRVHQDDTLFDPALLDEWLRQEGWPGEARTQLVGEYEAARSLLSAYDEEAPSR